MIIGVLKEIKTRENRVSVRPGGVEVMKKHGHTVLVEKDAGIGSGFADEEYKKAGAELIVSAAEIYKNADMVMHVKEPLKSEYKLIRKEQIIFTYLHLAASEELTRELIKRKSVNIAYETIQKKDGSLPLLTPMSEVAGRMAIQEGAKYLEKNYRRLGNFTRRRSRSRTRDGSGDRRGRCRNQCCQNRLRHGRKSVSAG